MTLRVTVEIVPGGDESRKREIGRMDISNITPPDEDGHLREISDYVVRGHHRSAGFLKLIQRAIDEGRENGGWQRTSENGRATWRTAPLRKRSKAND